MTTKMYLVKEGYCNLTKHGSKTFSTMLIICATMLVLGIFILLLVNVNYNVNVVVSQQGVQAFISDEKTEQDIEFMKNEVKNIPGIKDVTYISKEAAYLDAQNVFSNSSQNYLLDGLDKVLPFPASLVITFDNLTMANVIKDKLTKVDGIYKVKYNDTTINAVITIANVAKIFLIAVGSVMLLVSIFIISNTIKLAVYSNKREIYIMKYIGATNAFVRGPFIIEGAIMGIASAIISFFVISIPYAAVYAKVANVGTSIGVFGLVPYSTIWYEVLAIFLGIGIFIGILGSSISVKKYLDV